jgi:exodeoxyribonuclease VII large subunit
MTGNVYSVGQVNAYIKNMFAQDFMLNRISVRGEISNCKYHSSGHIYFTLKDETGILQAVMFSGSRTKGLKFRMKEGDNVIVLGAIRTYERDGKYQLYAQEIILEGAGLLYQKFEELKQELEEMGMFSEEYKRPIPKYASRIGVVTAPTGAAVRDIQNISHRRNPFVQLILYPAQVQGEGAAASIVQGICALEQLQVDVIIVGRGGGSIEDLWAFNEESVARAIFECNVPIISAVGHETDTTIADYVADMRAPTPSAAAELAVFDYRQVWEQTEAVKLRLNHQLCGKLEQAESIIRQYQLRLQVLNPKNQLLEKRQMTAEYQDRLQHRMEQVLQEKRHRMEMYASMLEGNSPLKKLSGGYAFLTKESGERVHGVSQLTTGDVIRAHMLDGSLVACVKEVNME